METPGFSSFRQDMEKWDEVTKKEKEALITAFLDSPSFAMFFKKDDKLFGAGEMDRVVFARMKDPEDECHSLEDTFMAYDLVKILLGERLQNSFDSKDLSKIEIIDKDNATKWLIKNSNKAPDAISAIRNMMVSIQ